jgi:hypothetical protein
VILAPCSQKGKLLKFSTQYDLYPKHWQKYIVFLKEGKPEYVVYKSDGYQERWIYLCQNKIFNFQLLPRDKTLDEEEDRFRITSEPLKGTDLEKKLPEKDRKYLMECIDKDKGYK